VSDEVKWQPISTAPFQTVIEVRNRVMDKPVLATTALGTLPC